MITTTSLVCTACGMNFEFTAEEQDFYQSKGFQTPRRCKPCRDSIKQGRNNQTAYIPVRTMYETVCAACSCQTQVPFKPSGAKPVYCRSCFTASNY